MREPTITFGHTFFLAIAGLWLYGLVTTFVYGRIPLVSWSTSHNLVLGALWLLVFGVGAAVPVKTFVNFSGFVAFTGRGRGYLPLFLGNVLLQLYFWILAITIWFPQPQPWPLSSLQGGPVRGLIALPVLITVVAVGNFICIRALRYLLRRVETKEGLEQ